MSKKETEDPRMAKALCRYEVVGRYLAMKPKRGLKRKLLEELASKAWTGPDGEPFFVAAETIRVWARRYRRSGLKGLMDKERPQRGVSVLSPEQRQVICNLKREVPERSLERIIGIAESMELVEPGVLRRSTVHRVLQDAGISTRGSKVPDRKDLDRFEADFPNDLWQSDLLKGPWLPDPSRPGKVRRAHLYAFLDDHSRALLFGRFSFKEDLPYLELVFRRSLQRMGVPRRVYYDNAQTYRSHHMKQIIAELGIYRLVFTTPHRPEGHGKIEAFNRYVRSAFLAELKASRITTLDELNEAFIAWADTEYNRRKHGETGEPPLLRWRAGVQHIRYAEEERLRQAFLWKETRTPDKTGVFSLLGTRYQVEPKLARRKVQVRFDPEALHEVEVWHQGNFVQRVKPFAVSAHRRPKATRQEPDEQAKQKPTADWLSHLVQKRRTEGIVEPPPRQHIQDALAKREKARFELIDILTDRLEPGIVNAAQVRDFTDRFGPFDPELAALTVDQLIAHGERRDQHVAFYLEAIKRAEQGGRG